MSASEQMAAAEGLGFVPYTRPTGTDTAEPLKIGVLISGSGADRPYLRRQAQRLD